MPAYLPQVLLILEIGSVVLVLTYLYFAVRQNAVAWIFGLAASVFSALFFYRQMYFGSMGLNVVYGLQAILGYYHWKWLDPDRKPAFRMPLNRHLLLILGCAGFAFVLRFLFAHLSVGDLMFWDLLLAGGSIAATFLEIRKDSSCWYYWMLCNAAYAVLYFTSSANGNTAYLYATLMLLLAVFSWFGLRAWKRPASDAAHKL